MKPVYQVWQHRVSGEVYSVRLEWHETRQHLTLTGVCGPTQPLEIGGNGVADDWYETGGIVHDMEARRDEFIILLPRAPWKAKR